VWAQPSGSPTGPASRTDQVGPAFLLSALLLLLLLRLLLLLSFSSSSSFSFYFSSSSSTSPRPLFLLALFLLLLLLARVLLLFPHLLPLLSVFFVLHVMLSAVPCDCQHAAVAADWHRRHDMPFLVLLVFCFSLQHSILI